MMWRTAACIVAVAVRAAAAYGACDTTDSCLRAIEHAQADTQTIDARFTQTKTVSLLNEPVISTGRFLFKRPDCMRLEIESPRPATIIINGRDISIPGISTSEQQQLSTAPMAAMFVELGAMFSGSPAALRRHFEVAAQSTDGSIDVTLTPTLAEWQKLFRTIRLRFSEPDFVVSSMRLDDALGDHLEIAMRDVHRNAELPENAFQLPSPSAK
jgi:outer membrane lipoprotein-sorting protein